MKIINNLKTYHCPKNKYMARSLKRYYKGRFKFRVSHLGRMTAYETHNFITYPDSTVIIQLMVFRGFNSDYGFIRKHITYRKMTQYAWDFYLSNQRVNRLKKLSDITIGR